jgi:hypothetical protein
MPALPPLPTRPAEPPVVVLALPEVPPVPGSTMSSLRQPTESKIVSAVMADADVTERRVGRDVTT